MTAGTILSFPQKPVRKLSDVLLLQVRHWVHVVTEGRRGASVPELALGHDHGCSLPGQLCGMAVAQVVERNMWHLRSLNDRPEVSLPDVVEVKRLPVHLAEDQAAIRVTGAELPDERGRDGHRVLAVRTSGVR